MRNEMSNEVVKPVFGGGVSMANPEALVNALENSVSNDPRGGSANGCEFLNFSGKGGRYEIGKDKDPMDPSELWVIDVTRFEDGWICWKNNKPVVTTSFDISTKRGRSTPIWHWTTQMMSARSAVSRPTSASVTKTPTMATRTKVTSIPMTSIPTTNRIPSPL